MAVRPQRLLPADAALIGSPGLSPVGIVVPGVQGLNLAAPIAVSAGAIGTTVATSAVLDVSGYNTFSWYVTADVNTAVDFYVRIVDPQGSGTAIATIDTGISLPAAGVPADVRFGSNFGACIGTAFYMIQLRIIRNTNVAFNLTMVSALTCSWA